MGRNVLRQASSCPCEAVLFRGPHADQLLAAPQRARSSCVWASGRGGALGGSRRQSGLGRGHQRIRLASWPVARANREPAAGSTTGRPAVAKAPVTARSRPPKSLPAQSESGGGLELVHGAVTPMGSFATAHRAPEGRTAMSNWALATSIPTKHGTSLIQTLSARPCEYEYALNNCTGSGVQDVTTHATLGLAGPRLNRSITSGSLREGDSHTSPLKDTVIPRGIVRRVRDKVEQSVATLQ